MKKTKTNNLIKKNPTVQNSTTDAMSSRGDLIVATDEMFGVGLVYSYGTFAEYNVLREKLFGDTTKICNAHGYCSNGLMKLLQCPGILVWINSIIPRDQSFPYLIHEISHLADFILENAKADDKTGEVRAYIIGREVARIFPTMFNLKCFNPLDVEQVKELLKCQSHSNPTD